MNESMISRVIVACALLALGGFAQAGGYRCPSGAHIVDGNRCADGSMAMFEATELSLDNGRKPDDGKNREDRRNGSAKQPPFYFGVWSTGVRGAVWQSPSQVPGYDRLNISPGVAAGDLTISANGYYTWNSYGGKVGQWVKGDADYPVVLIDTVEGKRWKVGYDDNRPGKHAIFIWDGSIWYNGHRK